MAAVEAAGEGSVVVVVGGTLEELHAARATAITNAALMLAQRVGERLLGTGRV